MTRTIERTAEIPRARFYVLATDRFMSGWGPAQGRDNVVVFPCDTVADAEHVARVLKGRDEMIRVRVTGSRPRVRPSWLVSLFDRDTSTGFYPADQR